MFQIGVYRSVQRFISVGQGYGLAVKLTIRYLLGFAEMEHLPILFLLQNCNLGGKAIAFPYDGVVDKQNDKLKFEPAYTAKGVPPARPYFHSISIFLMP